MYIVVHPMRQLNKVKNTPYNILFDIFKQALTIRKEMNLEISLLTSLGRKNSWNGDLTNLIIQIFDMASLFWVAPKIKSTSIAYMFSSRLTLK